MLIDAPPPIQIFACYLISAKGGMFQKTHKGPELLTEVGGWRAKTVSIFDHFGRYPFASVSITYLAINHFWRVLEQSFR